MKLLLTLTLVLILPTLALASDTGLSGSEGHPRSRFPLSVSTAPTGDAALDAVVQRALDDWNTLARDALGVEAFARAEGRPDAPVAVTVEPPRSARLMGETQIDARDDVIVPPVRIVVFTPAARGETSRETVLYQVLAHELGHALGLEHVRDPRSIMCCVAGSVDFKDPAAREAYIEGRRHPDLRSVRAQLVAHYERFWRAHR